MSSNPTPRAKTCVEKNIEKQEQVLSTKNKQVSCVSFSIAWGNQLDFLLVALTQNFTESFP